MSPSEFARVWTKVLSNTSYVAMSRAEKTRFLNGLTERLADSLRADEFDPGIAQQVGTELADAGFTAPEALGRTVALIHTQLPHQAHQRLPELIEALTTGHAWATRHRTLDEQDELRHALLNAHATLAQERANARMALEQTLRDSEARFRYAAMHDALTELPNRISFTTQLIETLAEPGTRLGVCFIDLDDFNTINDSLGHPVGDQLLRVIGGRLRKLSNDSGYYIARMGGDEFAILVEDTNNEDDVIKAADRALMVVREPVTVRQHELSISASAGVVERPVAITDATEMMTDADMTLHWAKADGKARWASFDPARKARDLARYQLSADMPRALADGEFVLVYQPLVDLNTRELAGVEALARWDNPARGRLMPDSFIGLAERTGLIVPLGTHLLALACRQAVRWLDLNPSAPFVSVNIASHQIAHPGLVANVATILDRTRLPANMLQLEITETAATGTNKETLETLRGLTNLGVRIALDDFGTGYSNFAYLPELPVHGIKLSAKFLDTKRELVAGMVSTGRDLGLTITAEGIETAQQAARLHQIGCHLGQGYHLGRPCAPEQIDRML